MDPFYADIFEIDGVFSGDVQGPDDQFRWAAFQIHFAKPHGRPDFLINLASWNPVGT